MLCTDYGFPFTLMFLFSPFPRWDESPCPDPPFHLYCVFFLRNIGVSIPAIGQRIAMLYQPTVEIKVVQVTRRQ